MPIVPPAGFLRHAARKVTQVVAVLEAALPEEGAALRAVVAEAVGAVAQELIGPRQH